MMYKQIIKTFCVERIDLPMKQIQSALESTDWTQKVITILGITFYVLPNQVSYSIEGSTMSYTINP
jgi:hypothetical protein